MSYKKFKINAVFLLIVEPSRYTEKSLVLLSFLPCMPQGKKATYYDSMACIR